jgi:uncharacterized membrane protein
LGEQSEWHGGMLYYNPNDKKIFLPKRFGGGYTLNFAKPFSIVLSVLIIMVFFTMVILNIIQK